MPRRALTVSVASVWSSMSLKRVAPGALACHCSEGVASPVALAENVTSLPSTPVPSVTSASCASAVTVGEIPKEGDGEGGDGDEPSDRVRH
jgi:hypothetical protein